MIPWVGGGWAAARRPGFISKLDLRSHQRGCLTPSVLSQAPLLFGWHNRCRDVVTVCPHLIICCSPACHRLGNTFNGAGSRNLLGLNQTCSLKPGDICGHVADTKQMVLSTYDQLIDHVTRHPQWCESKKFKLTNTKKGATSSLNLKTILWSVVFLLMDVLIHYRPPTEKIRFLTLLTSIWCFCLYCKTHRDLIKQQNPWLSFSTRKLQRSNDRRRKTDRMSYITQLRKQSCRFWVGLLWRITRCFCQITMQRLVLVA